MTLKNNKKSEEEWTCCSKTDMRNLINFDPSTQNLKNLHFNGLLVIKNIKCFSLESREEFDV